MAGATTASAPSSFPSESLIRAGVRFGSRRPSAGPLARAASSHAFLFIFFTHFFFVFSFHFFLIIIFNLFSMF
jgi:hypothetical protein